MAAKARLKGDKSDDFFLGELNAKVDQIISGLETLKTSTEKRLDSIDVEMKAQAAALDEHDNDDAKRFGSIEKYIWQVVGMGILLTFLVAVASLGWTIYKSAQTVSVEKVIDVEKALKDQKERQQ